MKQIFEMTNGNMQSYKLTSLAVYLQTGSDINQQSFVLRSTAYTAVSPNPYRIGEFKKILPFAKAALAQAPDQRNKENIEIMIKKLEEGKDVN